MASAAFDQTIKVWDANASAASYDYTGGDKWWSIGWNFDGSMLAAAGKDKKLYVLDPRAPDAVKIVPAFSSTKA